MKELTIKATGQTWSDLEDALEEIRSAVESECIAGFNRNETGRYHFDVVKHDA